MRTDRKRAPRSAPPPSPPRVSGIPAASATTGGGEGASAPEAFGSIVGDTRCVPYSLTANLRAQILDFRGFDSSRILILRGGIIMSIGNFLESLSQAILVGRFLVGRLGVLSVSLSSTLDESVLYI